MVSNREKFANYISNNNTVDFFILDELILTFDLLDLVVFNFPKSKIIILMKGKRGEYRESGRVVFYSKPVSEQSLKLILNCKKALIKPSNSLKENHLLLGSSDKMQKLREELALLGREDCPVLLYGESGTGKELAAEILHQNSKYCFKPKETVNCSILNSSIVDSILFGHTKSAFTGALEETVGLFEKANDNTLFLDEIENITMDSQASLLRVIELGEYRKVGGNSLCKSNFRLISASNKDLKALVRQKLFRSDFYFRVARIQVHLPSLEEHISDIDELVFHYYKRVNEERRVEKDFMKKLKELKWPGNVRQLNSVLEKSRIYSSTSIIRLKT